MRPVTLEDVQNALSWDAETLKALMCNGNLHVMSTIVEMKSVCEHGGKLPSTCSYYCTSFTGMSSR